MLTQAWRYFDEHVPTARGEPTIGSRMNLMLACFSVSFLRAAVAAGIEREYAIELFADCAWTVYARWAVLPWGIAQLMTRDPVMRMRTAVNLFLRFPFNPPGYVFERLPAEDGIAFDMRRCPVAEYFRAQNAADLCVASWCNLDYALAENWGGALERTGTLAEGDVCCTFRFKVARG